MVNKQEEIHKFIKDRKIWKVLLQVPFNEQEFRDTKREYFINYLNNVLNGIPRDPDIARVAIDYLFKIGYIKNKEDLDGVLQTDYFSENLFNKKDYYDKLETKTKDQKHDLGLIKKLEYESSKLKGETVIEQPESMGEVETEIFTTNDTTAQPSLETNISINTDSEGNISEINDFIDTNNKYEPWWQKINLASDPFPTYDGLGDIPPEIYKDFIIMTSVYQKYISFIEKYPSELFKNTVFYGQFGSGKTTLFEYLKKPLIDKTIYPAYIRLSAEPDYQNFLIKFKQKLVRELENIYYSLTGSDIAPELNSMNIDDSIAFIFKSIEKRKPCKGFVILIDDIYKLPDYEHVALKFLNHLQTFKAELTRELQLPNVGFFISAPPDWKEKLSKPIYSGSVSREEDMPKPSPENALDMLNERLTAFSFDKKKRQWIKLDFAQQVYRALESRKGFTFRDFIKECLRRFENGDFGILIANPVSIPGNIFRNLLQILKDNEVNKNFNEILNSSISSRDKTECVQLLIKVCNNKGFNEDSELYKTKTHYFMLLRNAGLIYPKIQNDGSKLWAVSKEFQTFNEIIWNQYQYSINDYLLKLFRGRLDDTASQTVTPVRKEMSVYEELKNYISKKNDKRFPDISYWVDQAFNIHKRIISEINAPYIQASYNKMERDCKESIDAITKAVSSFAAITASPSEFWNLFWYKPQALHDYVHVHRSQKQLPDPSVIYLFSSYDSLFLELFFFLNDEIHKNDIMPIPNLGLIDSEIQILHGARTDYVNQDYPAALRKIIPMIETKLRDFIYSVFLLQYGDRNHRMQRIPANLHKFIKDNPQKDKRYGFESVGNELTYLNRHQYYPILLGPGQVGYDNWYYTFSKIFVPWDRTRTASYMQTFFRFNLPSSHNKEEVLKKEYPSNVYEFIINSVTLLGMINKSYFAFLDNVKLLQITGSTESGYYFSLDSCKDKHLLQPVRISPETENKLLGLLRDRINTIDLSDPSVLEQKYGVSYRELFAILHKILKQSGTNSNVKIIRENSPVIILSMN